MAHYGFQNYHQASLEELQQRARNSAALQEKKGHSLEPVIAKTRRGSVCTSWWGNAWCSNLEQYADYASRLERGKRYVRAGTVLDLKIRQGHIQALVQGSRRKPYKVEIRIKPLSQKRKESIEALCSRKISSLADLVSGSFPEQLQSLFTGQEGLFPTPDEIEFSCSCPDWAYMCKHVAAVMYAIGVRLDENPFFFFELRGMDPDLLIRKSVADKVGAMLEHADEPSERTISQDEVLDLFGLDPDSHI